MVRSYKGQVPFYSIIFGILNGWLVCQEVLLVEIGHGSLAFRALKGMISPDNPCPIRVVSDILESNGSSSMATYAGVWL